MKRIRLGVNVDHVATLRQQRRGKDPDPVAFALEAERAGADLIVCHLREDRRHIQDDDVRKLRDAIGTRLNLEMGLSQDIIDVALKVHPDQVTLVPERRQELTTEGGLDVVRAAGKIRNEIRRFHDAGIDVSLFIDPEEAQVRAARIVGARFIELHTGEYAHHPGKRELQRIAQALHIGSGEGLSLAVGHGLDYTNTRAVAKLTLVGEANIGYAIVVRALSVGWTRAVREMKSLLR